MRAKQNVLHTMSRKGYARLEEEMKNQSPHPDSISRIDVWIKGHTRKKEKPVNEVLQAAVKKVEELHKPSTKEGPMSTKDDAIVHAFGPERRGSVRGLGFGALPSKVDVQVYQNQNVRKLNQQMLLLQQELQEMRAEILKGKRQNEEPSEDAMGRKRSHGET
ncbi:uncharacterized protein LOC114309374 [Camellia sinensis]|uniref:uncharacterized protein LOC114309374 n=1 Tax=Camellia sinensis TaxID=4442 RepID=UPI0010361013|nr:uncharacterized protein LOC114309374 [Camellia sinensis]